MGFLSSLVEWSLNHRAIVLGATILFAIAGIDSALKMKIDAVPDITTIQVQVITAAPALSAIEIEQYVTFAVERSITGTPHLEEVRSISRYGLSVVTAVFKDGTDIHLARQLIGEKLRDASSAIPARYGRPDMGPISTGLGEIFQFTLRSKNHSMRDLTSYLNWNINPRLKSVPGIVEVNTFGGEVKQYQVILNSNRMQALGITGTDVFDSIQKNNAAAGGGYIEKGNEHFVIGTEGMISSIDDMKNIIVGSAGKGNPVKLSSIAEIRIGGRLRRGASTMDGNGEVTGAITMMLMNENSLTASENVKKAIAEISKTLPDGMRIESFYDRSEVVKKTIRTVFINLLEGAILVIVVLLLMLGNIRAGIVFSLTIPLAMFFAIMIMRIR
ncbi:MAG: efflux RND transporter permease subunit, partial [Leptospira sp.]|nr:efflux RND transporter permease subunit [Leptospira sp.]